MNRDKVTFRFPIQRKLFLFFLCAIIIPLLLFGSFLYVQQLRVLEDEIASASQRELVQIAERVNMELIQVQAISNLIYLDEDITELLKRANTLQADEDTAYLQQALTRQIGRYNTGLNNFSLKAAVLDTGGRAWGGIEQQSLQDCETRAWYQQLVQRSSDLLWVQDSQLDEVFSTTDYPYIYLIRQLHDRSTWQPLGTLIIGIPELDLQKIYYGYVGWDQSCYIVDRNDHLISEVNNLNFELFPQAIISNTVAYSGAHHIEGTGQGRLLVNHYTILSTQWRIITISNLASRFSRFSTVLGVFFFILLLYLGITVILSSVMARWFARPINNIYSSILEVQGGDLSVRVPVTTKDEVGEVATQFNTMLREVRELMAKNEQEQKLKRDAEILSLQTQINPHFLYNTLASVRYLIYTEDKKKADDVILALIRLMKNTLSDSSEFVTVESEIALLHDYIALQTITFDRPICVEIDISKEIQSYKTIKLLLQPIVENAFLHGLKPQKGTLRLAVRGYILDEALIFEVEDSGVGFDTSAAHYADRNPSSRSIGVQNVHNRIKLTFGDDYGLRIDSRQGEGTRVVLRLPIMSSKGEYSSYEHFSGG